MSTLRLVNFRSRQTPKPVAAVRLIKFRSTAYENLAKGRLYDFKSRVQNPVVTISLDGPSAAEPEEKIYVSCAYPTGDAFIFSQTSGPVGQWLESSGPSNTFTMPKSLASTPVPVVLHVDVYEDGNQVAQGNLEVICYPPHRHVLKAGVWEPVFEYRWKP